MKDGIDSDKVTASEKSLKSRAILARLPANGFLSEQVVDKQGVRNSADSERNGPSGKLSYLLCYLLPPVKLLLFLLVSSKSLMTSKIKKYSRNEHMPHSTWSIIRAKDDIVREAPATARSGES